MKSAQYLVFFVEEPSMEAFLTALLPNALPENVPYEIRPFNGKHDMLKKLENRLLVYSGWIPEEYRIFILIDKDSDDCQQLKQKIEEWVQKAGLTSRSQARLTGNPFAWQVVIRVVEAELEAWYFGDWQAVMQAYPKVPKNTHRKAAYRAPDQIPSPSDALEQIMQRAGYFRTGLRKIELASTLGKRISPQSNRSHSFQRFYEALLEAVGP